MPLARLTFQSTITGIAGLVGARTVNAGHAEVANPESVLAAQPGTLSTRTDNDTGTLTLGASHGITTGQRIDLYWTGGSRYGVTVGTVAGTSVPIDLGAGDNLPVATTAIVVGIPVNESFSLDGDDVAALALGGGGANRSRFVFLNAGGAAVTLLVAASEVYDWKGDGTNPLAGFVPVSVWISHEDVTAARDGLVAVALTA